MLLWAFPLPKAPEFTGPPAEGLMPAECHSKNMIRFGLNTRFFLTSSSFGSGGTRIGHFEAKRVSEINRNLRSSIEVLP
jgi:hypothetical protein